MRTRIGMFTVFVDPPPSLMFPFDEDMREPLHSEPLREPCPIDKIKKNMRHRIHNTNVIKITPQKTIYGFRLI